jgi:flavin reductase (DIM6/NTAB) family NADH-FMN oxidoreductase RutF
MMELLEADGELLALEVKRTLAAKKSTQRKVMAKKVASLELDERVRAIGHITTSLSVITANINGEDSMVPVTWVSQASFNPPGITVSVPKEGSPDGLTLLNSKFSINIMGEGKQGPTLKLLNSGTRVGASAFDGFSIERDEATGCAYLTDAASVMQCSVTNRLDTGDHWLLLSTIEEGKVLDANAVTYFHHREDGSKY